MPRTNARPLSQTARERRWDLLAAIASIAVFGLGVGQFAPLLSLLLEAGGTDATLTGLNAGAPFIGVIIGPLLAPRWVRSLGIRNFLLVCFAIQIALTLALKVFDTLAAWFALRALLGVVGSAIFTSGEAWINQLASGPGRGRIVGIYAAALSAGFGAGPLILSVTGIEGWLPFLANAAIAALATLPLFSVGDASRDFGREHTAGALSMFGRAPLILGVVVVFGLYESALITLLPIWGVRNGLDQHLAAATLSAVYGGSIVLQLLIAWLSDKLSRATALRFCAVIGFFGALVLVSVAVSPLVLFCLLFVWGGTAAGIYPVVLSMAGDWFPERELVGINAAIIIAYGIGALVGPALGGAAMDFRDPQGLLWMFALLFGGLLAATLGGLSHRAAVVVTTDRRPPPDSV